MNGWHIVIGVFIVAVLLTGLWKSGSNPDPYDDY
jgi:FtsZ-interacting cell division protein ZipA